MHAGQYGNKNLLHLTVLNTSPLLYTRDAFLENAKAMIGRDACHASIDLGSMPVSGPFHKMILEYASVELVQEVGCDAREDVGIGQSNAAL